MDFQEHTIQNTTIKVVSGTILAQDNVLNSEHNLYYWANFVPHYKAGHFFIIGECGFNAVNKKTKFFFEYVEDTDTVIVKEYRLTVCNPDVYEQYYLQTKYGTPKKDETIIIPWKRICSNHGVAVPQLIERIFGKIPTVMFFV